MLSSAALLGYRMFTLGDKFGGSVWPAKGYASAGSGKRDCAAQHNGGGSRHSGGIQGNPSPKSANLDETPPLLTLFRSRFRADGDVFASRYSFGNDRWILESSPRIDCQTMAVAVEED